MRVRACFLSEVERASAVTGGVGWLRVWLVGWLVCAGVRLRVCLRVCVRVFVSWFVRVCPVLG